MKPKDSPWAAYGRIFVYILGFPAAGGLLGALIEKKRPSTFPWIVVLVVFGLLMGLVRVYKEWLKNNHE